MTVRLLAVAWMILVMALTDAAPESRSNGLPRLEFEMPPSPSPKAATPQRAVVSKTPRGVMGYRLPLVSRQQVPDQVVSGVLIPAHKTYVILKPGYWELVDSTEGEVEAVPTANKVEADNPPSQAKSGIPGWYIWRLFRRSG